MWAFVKGLFGAPEIVSAVADTVKGGMTMLDKAFYTDQEKAENAIKYTDVWLKLQMIMANDNSIAATIRRVIAVFVIGDFIFLLTFAAMAHHWYPEWATFILKIIIDGYLMYIVLAIVSTMFATYGIGKYVSKDNVPFSTASIDGEAKKSS